MGDSMTVKSLQQLLASELENQEEYAEDLEDIRITAPGRQAFSADKVASVTYGHLDDFEGDTGYGGESLPRLHAWTEDRVYFKVVYDGSERVQSVPRNPSDEPPDRIG